MSEYLSIQHIQKQFDAFTALKDISFTVNKNEFVCLLGPSGCGKTTLLRILSGTRGTNDWQYSCEWKKILQHCLLERETSEWFSNRMLYFRI